MQHNNRSLVLVLITAGLLLSACGRASAVVATKTQPVQLEKIEGTEFNRVILTEKAAQRLDIQTAPVRDQQVNGVQRKVIPYAAVIYDLKGGTWVYTSPEPLTFVRQPITIDYIEGDTVVLLDGPPTGTEVATVGVAELYGANTGVGK